MRAHRTKHTEESNIWKQKRSTHMRAQAHIGEHAYESTHTRAHTHGRKPRHMSLKMPGPVARWVWRWLWRHCRLWALILKVRILPGPYYFSISSFCFRRLLGSNPSRSFILSLLSFSCLPFHHGFRCMSWDWLRKPPSKQKTIDCPIGKRNQIIFSKSWISMEIPIIFASLLSSFLVKSY